MPNRAPAGVHRECAGSRWLCVRTWPRHRAVAAVAIAFYRGGVNGADQAAAGSSPPEDGSPSGGGNAGRDTRTVVPIVAAFGVVALILIAIVVGGMLAPAEKNVTEADKVAVAVRDFVAARNSNDPNRVRAAVCPAFDEARTPLPAVQAELVRVEHAQVDNGRGTAEVTVKTGGTERTATWKLAHHDGRWRVCV